MIYLPTTSTTMTDREKKRGRQKIQKFEYLAREKRAFQMK